MALQIVNVNPLEHEAGLKALMTSHENPGFARFFDHGYPDAVREGARSWIGVDEGGTLQTSMTVFIHHFEFGGRRVRAGMLGNMMAATEYRTFFPALALMRRVVGDVRQQGELDLVYGDPGPKGAQAICQGARMQQVGALDRFVIPLRDSRWHRRVAIAAYATGLQLRTFAKSAPARCVLASECDLGNVCAPLEASDHLEALHSAELYRRRLPGFPGLDDYILEFANPHGGSGPAAVVMLRGPRDNGALTIYVIRRRAAVPLKSLVPALITLGRELGASRIQLEAPAGSALATALTEGGFVPRSDLVPLFAVPFTSLGAEVVAAADRWEMTGVDMER